MSTKFIRPFIRSMFLLRSQHLTAVLLVLSALVSVGALFVLLQIKLGLSKELVFSMLPSIIAFSVGLLSANIASVIKKVSPKRVFISYPESEKETAKKLANLIRVNGYKVWLDEEQILPGEKWTDKIKNAIIDAEVFVTLLKADYSNSDAVMFELVYASTQKKLKVVPVLLDNMKMPPQLNGFRFIDAYTDIDKGLKEVMRAID